MHHEHARFRTWSPRTAAPRTDSNEQPVLDQRDLAPPFSNLIQYLPNATVPPLLLGAVIRQHTVPNTPSKNSMSATVTMPSPLTSDSQQSSMQPNPPSTGHFREALHLVPTSVGHDDHPIASVRLLLRVGQVLRAPVSQRFHQRLRPSVWLGCGKSLASCGVSSCC